MIGTHKKIQEWMNNHWISHVQDIQTAQTKAGDCSMVKLDMKYFPWQGFILNKYKQVMREMM